MKVFSCWTLFLFYLNWTSALKILGLFPHPGSSHFAVFRPLLIELADRGHHLTVISHFPLNQPLKNYNDISLKGTIPILKSVYRFEFFTYHGLTEKIARQWDNAYILTKMGYESCTAMLEDSKVQNLVGEQFDVILVEDFNSDCAMGLVYKLKSPFIGLTSNVIMSWNHNKLGLITNPSVAPVHFLGYGSKPNFLQRLESFILMHFYDWYYYMFSQKVEYELVKRYLGKDIPPLEEISKNMSLLLANTYFPFTGPKYYPPNVVEVGGLYHQNVKELPKDIKVFLDEAKQGVILFSMGSMLNASSLPGDKLKAFQMAFSELDQKVLMKWEDDVMPEQPENVKITRWLPQYDALHHENVVGFVTHAGMLGLSEAVKAGVPVLSIPIYGDQFNNAVSAEESDAGITIDYKNITFQSIKWALKQLLEPRLQNEAKRLSKVWNDRPLSAMDTAIYWIEHVVRHGGGHLRHRSADLPYYKYFLLDVLGSLIALMLIFIYLIYKCLKCIFKSDKKSKSD